MDYQLVMLLNKLKIYNYKLRPINILELVKMLIGLKSNLITWSFYKIIPLLQTIH